MKVKELKRANVLEIDVVEFPSKEIIGTLFLEQNIKYPGDIIVINDKSYITVEKVHHYYYDGAKYQFAKVRLYVRALEKFY